MAYEYYVSIMCKPYFRYTILDSKNRGPRSNIRESICLKCFMISQWSYNDTNAGVLDRVMKEMFKIYKLIILTSRISPANIIFKSYSIYIIQYVYERKRIMVMKTHVSLESNSVYFSKDFPK